MNVNAHNQNIPDGGEIANNDMDMSSAELDRMDPRVAAAMGRPEIKQAFDHFEWKANRAKRWHNYVGTLSLILLIVALEFSLLKLSNFQNLETTLKPYMTFVVIVGMVPFVCAFLLHAFKTHEHWVLARFKAERIRHWKFQQLIDGCYVESLTNAAHPDNGFEEHWQALVDDLKFGTTQMRDYVSNRHFSSPFTHRPYVNTQTFRNAALVYQRSRLLLQLHWFNQESERYKKADQWTKNVAGILLMLSVISAFVEGLLWFVPLGKPDSWIEPTLAAAGIGMALLSVGIRVYRSASGISESAERYQRLSAQLLWFRGNYEMILAQETLDQTIQKQLFKIVEDVERLCHGELVEFIRVSEKSDYLF